MSLSGETMAHLEHFGELGSHTAVGWYAKSLGSVAVVAFLSC